MGTGQRSQMKGSEAPGPGGYDIKLSPDGPQYTMGGKGAMERRQDAPGPG